MPPIRRWFSVKSVSRDTIMAMSGQVRMNGRAGFEKLNWLKIHVRQDLLFLNCPQGIDTEVAAYLVLF